jgi:PiT family inorganic phosphate transporter
MNFWLIGTFVLGFLMAFSIGANDAANSLGVPFGTRAVSLTKLIIIGAAAEFVGAMFFSGNVASTLGTKIILDLDSQSNEMQDIIMFSVCFSTFVFISLSVGWSMPISGTQAVIGSLLGAGCVTVGNANLNWNEILHIALSWVYSPILAGWVSLMTIALIAKFSMDTKYLSYRTRILGTQFMIAIFSAVIADLFHDLVDTDEIAPVNEINTMNSRK